MATLSKMIGARPLAAALILVVVLAAATVAGLSRGSASAQATEPQFTSEYMLKDCKFKSQGMNPYFVLEPGYRLELKGTEDGEASRLVAAVLHQTEDVAVPGVGTVATRVLQERHTLGGTLVEISRNFFAICKQTNDVYYFGEETDMYNEDGSVTHEGSWRAGVDGAMPGIAMPGTFLLGSRYFQEVAPGVAMDRAEHPGQGLQMDTAAGSFDHCVQVRETTPLEPGAEDFKMYCAGVGLVSDGFSELVKVVKPAH